MSEDESHDLMAVRRSKMLALKNAGISPFGSAFGPVERSSQLLAGFEEGRKACFAGRILAHRKMGKSQFMHLADEDGSFQIYLRKDELSEAALETFKQVDLGDFIGVQGTLFKTQTGEPTLHAREFTFLSKALRPLPAKWHGLTDTEQRYRQRYLDLISNDEVRRVLTLRCRMVAEIRAYLIERGFLEVETPMMQAVPGGAAANPFVTHHKALDIDLYLRIAPELYLKRLLVGGYTRIFELNRNFRNEGLSRKHNPEFTMLELYQAFSDFEGMADLVEGLIVHLAEKFCGGTTLRHEKADGSVLEINLARPWKRRTYHDCIRDVAGADWFDLSADQRRDRAQNELQLEILPHLEDFEVTNQVFEKCVEAKTMDPLFVTHLPKELVPLAKQNAENPDLVDVYELIVNGQELSPGYSELNDPDEQRSRLEDQAGEEVQKLDDDFLLALEHGMPPAGGLGLGIDRLVMLLTGAESIRDVIYFPLMRPKV
ncbi:MAG: lysine--tRNA ligase [Candidatus Methylacidiphilales bacterium]